MDTAIASSNKFGWKLLLTERKQNSKNNVLFSSFSITAVLSMLYAGAKANTEKQIENILNLKNEQSTHQKFRHLFKSFCSSSEDIVLNIANLLIVDANYDILPDFSNCLKLNYSAETNKQFNFQCEAEKARKGINQLIETATKEKIKDMLSENSVEPDTKLMLINATYFKGNWRMAFDRTSTSRKPFYTINNEEVMVDMMFRKDDYRYFYIERLKVSFLEIPYVGNKFSMIVILPDEIDGLPNIEKNISVDDINRGIAKMRKEKDICFSLPKFKLEESFPLKDRLIQLGMTDAFGENADLSGISGKKDLKISIAIHKAFVEVNEEGTEAAAADVMLVEKVCDRMLDFVVNHPFMFIIRDTTSGLMLFTGSVYKL